MDIEQARENAASIEGSGSTTAILDRYKIQPEYQGAGRVFVRAETLNAVFEPILKEFFVEFKEFNDLPGPHPWQAEITLKKCFKNLLDSQQSPCNVIEQ